MTTKSIKINISKFRILFLNYVPLKWSSGHSGSVKMVVQDIRIKGLTNYGTPNLPHEIPRGVGFTKSRQATRAPSFDASYRNLTERIHAKIQ